MALGSVAGILLLFLATIVTLTYTGFYGQLPDYAELKNIRNSTASEVYSEDGVLFRKYYVQNRINADFTEISPHLINALIATEDARFFEHGGIDFKAWLRVLVKTILMDNRSSGGGSTLSQQLAKNVFPREEHPPFTILVSKLKETFIARRLEKLYSKEELLKLYLNTVPFGDNIYGIKVAAQRFFDKSPQDLQLEEAAVLVGMLKGNSIYHPVRHPERSLRRRNTVLAQMHKYGYLETEVRDSIQQLELDVHAYRSNDQSLGLYFSEHLRLKVEEILKDYKKPDGSTYNLRTDGLKIYTTINTKLQRYAEAAVNEHMAILQGQYYKEWARGTPWGKSDAFKNALHNSNRYQNLKKKGLSDDQIIDIMEDTVKMTIFNWKDGGYIQTEKSPIDSIKYYLTILNTGFLAMEPQTGLVKAWVGGINYQYFQYDHVKARRQVGSTFKPVVFAQALINGMLPCEYTNNELKTYEEFEYWQPRNSDGKYGGVYSMEGALSNSVNVAAVEVLMRGGIDSVVTLAHNMGIDSPIPPVPSIALGTMEASLSDMVQVYGTFANRGRRPEMHYLDRIETSSGQVIVEFDRPDPSTFEEVLSQDHADIMIKMMQTVVDSGTAKRLRYRHGLYNPIAGKTGTTQNHSDGWFIGFTPKIVAGVWVGAEHPAIHFKSLSAGQGANTALPIWGKFMKKVYADPEFKNWKYAKFPELARESWALMQCPPYLEEMPIIADYWNEENIEDYMTLKRQLPDIPVEQLITLMERKPKRRFESLYDYSERLARLAGKQLRRDERRVRRKEFWNDLLFGEKKKNRRN